MALSRPLRLANKQTGLYEDDLQNLLIQQTEQVLEIDLQEFPKVNYWEIVLGIDWECIEWCNDEF